MIVGMQASEPELVGFCRKCKCVIHKTFAVVFYVKMGGRYFLPPGL